MPTVECGFPQNPATGLSPADTLVRIGPTIWVIIGAHPGSAQASTTTGASIIEQVPALIDTGANLSSIDDALAQSLQLPIVDQWESGTAGGKVIQNVYLAQITIPSLATVQLGRFGGAHLEKAGSPHRALIGRSLLKECTLTYDGKTASVKLAR